VECEPHRHFVRIKILPETREDLIAGFRFYENQAPGARLQT
jgi:hypothetical protein